MTGLQGVTAMDDIRINAEKRAANPSIAPAGAAFETERQKQKAALVRQLDELDPSRVRKISAYSETQVNNKELTLGSLFDGSVGQFTIYNKKTSDRLVVLQLLLNALSATIIDYPL